MDTPEDPLAATLPPDYRTLVGTECYAAHQKLYGRFISAGGKSIVITWAKPGVGRVSLCSVRGVGESWRVLALSLPM